MCKTISFCIETVADLQALLPKTDLVKLCRENGYNYPEIESTCLCSLTVKQIQQALKDNGWGFTEPDKFGNIYAERTKQTPPEGKGIE